MVTVVVVVELEIEEVYDVVVVVNETVLVPEYE